MIVGWMWLLLIPITMLSLLLYTVLCGPWRVIKAFSHGVYLCIRNPTRWPVHS